MSRMTPRLRRCQNTELPLMHTIATRCLGVKKKSYSPPISAEPIPVHHLGPKAFFLEPLLVLGSSILWVAVLPCAGLFWSVAVLWKRTAGIA